MLRVVGKHLRLAGPVFEDLRRKFDKIARRIGPRETGVALAGEQPMQGMAELMKQGDHLIPRQQRALPCLRTDVVADIVDNRALRAQSRLFDKHIHPCAAAL
ncbi:Uncharacterised protein [Klebsiella pneumoniae]|nr:Uncharacterised protein [Klebsiella pneumoniae]